VITKSKGLKVSQPASLPSYANMGLGGIAGAGKTHLTGTLGKDGKLLSLDIEGGTASFNSQAFKNDPRRTDNIDVIQFDDVTNTTDLVHQVEHPLDHLIRTKNEDGYTLVVLDSLTEFQERFLSMHQAPDKRQSYGALRDALYGIVRKAQAVPAHTLFTARLKATHDEVLNREIVRFEVSPGVYSVISGLFDVIGFLDLKSVGIGKNAKTVRVFDSTHNMRTPGKDRYGIGVVESPAFTDITKVINGGN